MSSLLDRKIIEVGYFLARRGLNTPPSELTANSWKEAYGKFYQVFGQQKSTEEFYNSLKNIRDHFDSHLQNDWEGWKDEDGRPQKLSPVYEDVFHVFSRMNDKQLWEFIRPIVSMSYNDKIAKKKNTAVKESGANYFSSEFSGVKKTKGRELSETHVYHGVVVDSLKKHVEFLYPKAFAFNTQKIDLAIELNNKISHVFEVKTSTDSQSVYTAVGQVLMHSVGLMGVEKVIVLPKTTENVEVTKCLNDLGICLWFYNICDDKVIFDHYTKGLI
jgi:hypothetical protein